jgi:hypothetical protein
LVATRAKPAAIAAEVMQAEEEAGEEVAAAEEDTEEDATALGEEASRCGRRWT